ncbi:MAG TPA: hypothetical protein VKZ76_02920, partial [Edaphocola sp.]|nr:hypothetical protein [Edaphocola sp.]
MLFWACPAAVFPAGSNGKAEVLTQNSVTSIRAAAGLAIPFKSSLQGAATSDITHILAAHSVWCIE